MSKVDYDTLLQEHKDDVHVVGAEPKNLIDITVDKHYNYRLTNPLLIVGSVFLHAVVLLVMPVLLFFKHGLIVKGKRNLKRLGKSGAVSIANHVLPLDGVMVAMSVMPKRVIFHSLEENFGLPVVRHLLKMLGAIPIPNQITARAAYIKATNEFLANGKVVQIYPEASLWPNYDGIREFKTGAFHFAAKNNVPILPINLHFRTPRGLLKYLWLRDDLVTVHIGKPIYPNPELPFKQSLQDLRVRSHQYMVRANKFYKYLDAQETVAEQQEQQKEI